jgi:hypothetical protein
MINTAFPSAWEFVPTTTSDVDHEGPPSKNHGIPELEVLVQVSRAGK